MKEIPFDPYDFFGYIMSGLVILVGLEFAFGVPKIVGVDHKTLDLVLISLAAYVVGQVAATPAKALLEDFLARRVLGPPSVNLMLARPPRVRRFFFPGYYEPLSPQRREVILAKVKSEGLRQDSGEALFEHIRFRDYVRSDSALMARLGTFLNKYGFNRNLSFALLVFGVAALAGVPWDWKSELTRYAILGISLGVLLFYRYLKFYRQYSYELFNTYAGRG